MNIFNYILCFIFGLCTFLSSFENTGSGYEWVNLVIGLIGVWCLMLHGLLIARYNRKEAEKIKAEQEAEQERHRVMERRMELARDWNDCKNIAKKYQKM